MDFTIAVINTSWLTASLCFVIAGGNAYFAYYSWGRRALSLAAVSWFLFGMCFVFTQFGGAWFTENQRPYFRIATNIVIGSQIYSMLSMYIALRPIITARRRINGVRQPNNTE